MVSPVAKLELITAEVCPFAQRSHMALLEKGLEAVVNLLRDRHRPDSLRAGI